MAKFMVCGNMTVDVAVIVEAETLEEAIEIAEQEVSPEEYCNETVGVEVYDDSVELESLLCSGNIDWASEWSEEVK